MDRKVIFCISILLVSPLSKIYSFQEQLNSFVATQKAMIGNKVFLGAFAGLTAISLGLRFLENHSIKNAQPAGPITQNFAKDTLIRAEYSVDKIERVKIIFSNHTTRSNDPNSSNCIKVNLTDEQIVEALRLERAGSGHVLLNHNDYDFIKKRYPELAEKDLFLKLASRWSMLTSDTISLLKWDIIHQMVRTSRSNLGEMVPIIVAGAYACSYLEINKNQVFKGFFQDRLPRSILMVMVGGGLALLYREKKVIPNEIEQVRRLCKDQRIIMTQQRLMELNV
jgi:hypothetical protein